MYKYVCKYLTINNRSKKIIKQNILIAITITGFNSNKMIILKNGMICINIV